MIIVDLKTLELAAGIYGDPERAAETYRYQEAICRAMNAEHRNFEQDALCVYEGIARFLAQLIGGLPEEAQAAGVVTYVSQRAMMLAKEMHDKGATADFIVDGENGEIVSYGHSGTKQ